MTPINEKERTISLLKFSGLFMVVFVLGMLVLHFDYQMPKKQLDLLKEENAELNAARANIRTITIFTDSINARMLRYDTELNKNFIETQINSDIARLATMGAGDSSEIRNLLVNITNAYLQHLNDKKKMGDAALSSEKIADKDKEIIELKDQLKEAKRDYDLCRAMNSSGH